MPSRNLATNSVLSAPVVSATTPSSAHIACYGSMRGATAPLSHWWPTQTMSAADVMVRLGPSMAELWLKWMSMPPCLMWGLLSATEVTCCAPVGVAIVPLLPDVTWPGESCRKFLPVLTTRHLSPKVCGNVFKSWVRLVMPHDSQTWGPNNPELQRPAAMTVLWSAGIFTQKTEMNPQPRYYRNLELRTFRHSFAVLGWNGMAI